MDFQAKPGLTQVQMSNNKCPTYADCILVAIAPL